MKKNLSKLRISIAGIPTEIAGDDLDFLARYYDRFLCHFRPVLTLNIERGPLSSSGNLHRPPDKFFNLKCKRGIIHCDFLDCEGMIDIKRKKSVLRFANEYDNLKFELFLRVLYANILISEKSLVIHGASLIRNKNSYLFLGESGCGKSTVSMSAAATCDILSDDISVIRKINGVYEAFGSPFFGSSMVAEANPVNKHAPLKAVFLLIQSGSNRIEKMNKKEALLNLVCAIRYIPENVGVYKKAVGVLSDIADNTPLYKLYFTRQCNFWELIQ